VTLYDSRAIPAEHPPVLAALLDATRAVIDALHGPLPVTNALAAIDRYGKLAGLNRTEAHDRLVAAVGRAQRSPAFVGDEIDVLIAAYYAQQPDRGVTFVDPRGRIWRPAKGRNGNCVTLQGTRRMCTVRQTARKVGPLLRVDSAHAPVTHYDAAPGAEDPDAVYQVCAHDGESWPCRVAVAAGIAPPPTVAPVVPVSSERAPL